MPKHVFIFIPAFGNTVTTTTFLTTLSIQQTLAAKAINTSVSALSFPDIAELRSMAMTIWYDTMPHVDYLLFIDADMGFSPEIILDMVLFDEPLIGTIYPQRKLPVSWAGSGTGGPTTERRGNFMRVEGVGMGCTLIRRDLVTTMLQKMPELVDNRLELHPAASIMKSAGASRLIRAFEKLDIPDRGLVSEDLSFCIRWNQCGGQTWAAINYPISHVGMHDYNGCYLQHVNQQAAEAEQQTTIMRQIQAGIPPMLVGFDIAGRPVFQAPQPPSPPPAPVAHEVVFKDEPLPPQLDDPPEPPIPFINATPSKVISIRSMSPRRKPKPKTRKHK